jgi:hypothetical protein
MSKIIAVQFVDIIQFHSIQVYSEPINIYNIQINIKYTRTKGKEGNILTKLLYKQEYILYST